METVLVTGGAGYIGSHTVLDLIKKGFDVIIADDFSNSSKKVISILEKLADRKIKYYELDIRNKEGLREIFKENKIDAVINFAGHGVGKEMHEDPMIPNYGKPGTGAKIEDGMVITVEPMVNVGTYKVKILQDMWTAVTKDGKRSAQYEHSLAIVDGKPLILSVKD